MDPTQATGDNLLARRLLRRGVHREKPSLSFDKVALLKCHREAAVEFKAMQLKPTGSMICDLAQPSESGSSRCMSTLSDISISDMANMKGIQLPHIFKDNILHGTICVDAIKTFGDSLQTVLEDESGSAVVVSIRNTIFSTANRHEAADKFPEGLKVSIKSPQLTKLWDDGCVGLLVDNRQDIVPTVVWDPLPDVEFLNAGYGFHCRKEFTTAAVLYKRGIVALENVVNRTRDDEINLALLYIRQADALFQLGRKQEAFSYSSIALGSCDEGYVRLAESLAALHRFDHAISVLDQSDFPDKASKIEELEVERKQSEKGIYELDKYIGEAAPRNIYGPALDVENTPPILTEYVGPVEVRIGSEGQNKGRRGLHATRAVKAGELLFVNEVIAMGFSDPDSVFFRVGNILMPSEHFNLSVALAMKAESSPRIADQLNCLQADSSLHEIPDMALLTHMAATEVNSSKAATVNIKRIQDVACTNAQAAFIEGAKGQERSFCGLWLLYSFLNHSCVPNCEHYDIQGFKFVSAARDIVCGEELTTSYVYLLGTECARQGALDQHFATFHCECERCKFERYVGESIPAFAKLCNDFYRTFECESSFDDKVLVEKSLGFSCQVEKFLQNSQYAHFTQREKNWIRCSFGDAYLASYELEDSSPLQPFAAALLSIAPNTALVTVGKEMVKRAVRSLGLQEGDNSKEDLASELLLMSEKVYLPVKTKSLETLVNWCLRPRG